MATWTLIKTSRRGLVFSAVYNYTRGDATAKFNLLHGYRYVKRLQFRAMLLQHRAVSVSLAHCVPREIEARRIRESEKDPCGRGLAVCENMRLACRSRPSHRLCEAIFQLVISILIEPQLYAVRCCIDPVDTPQCVGRFVVVYSVYCQVCSTSLRKLAIA